MEWGASTFRSPSSPRATSADGGSGSVLCCAGRSWGAWTGAAEADAAGGTRTVERPARDAPIRSHLREVIMRQEVAVHRLPLRDCHPCEGAPGYGDANWGL